jgi:hypothetical protein
MNDMSKAWKDAYDKRPLNSLCSEMIEISVVGERCIYINDHRVAGGKPYVSENLPRKAKRTPLRDILDAFTEEQILTYLAEKHQITSYCAGLRAFRDAATAQCDGGGE